ncbi:MAG: hypothetical protein WEB58_06815 [Planctomycetaceae bacterium]
MPVDPLFPDKYPRGTSTGTVAILCEGDMNSYEADFLEKWASIALPLPNGPVVHVWPCGTGSAVRGMADAIGRTVHIVALLDRDFHEESSIAKVKKKWETDAGKLGWSFLGVCMWGRNEIENYFLDDDVLLPVMTEAFGCDEADVTQAVNVAVKLLVPFQALQYAFHKTRLAWEDSDPARSLIGPSRPQWMPTGLKAVDANKIEEDLRKRLEKWQVLVSGEDGHREPWKGDEFLSTYQAKVREWSNYSTHSAEWRDAWAGKEVLKLVRQQLAAKKAGWWSADEAKERPVTWSEMKNNRERDAHDRAIENELRPKLVNRLVVVITSNEADPRCEEFNELANLLKGGVVPEK